jgi:hypothetical protein
MIMSQGIVWSSNTDVPTSDVVGWGADAHLEKRPGVPMEVDPPAPIGNPSWTEPPQQTVGRPAVHGPLRRLTPVYGTVCPPRGISGLLRKAAYRIPEYKPRRWMLLLLADRVDVIEHNVGPAMLLLGGVAALAGGSIVAARLLRDR